MLNFERLIVWQKAIEYAESLVRIADSLPNKYQRLDLVTDKPGLFDIYNQAEEICKMLYGLGK